MNLQMNATGQTNMFTIHHSRILVVLYEFSGYLTRIHLKFWRMRTDKRVRGMCLHHLHVGVLPVSTHDIDLMMNTHYSGLDFKYKALGHTYMPAPIS